MRAIKSILAVGCLHANPQESADEIERFSWLAHYIAKTKPDVIVIGGDLWDNPSLNPHKGSTLLSGAGKEAPGQAAKHDLIADWEAGRSALDTILGVFQADNERHIRARHPERVYSPDGYFLCGNHEDFLDRNKRKHPSMRSITSTDRTAEYVSSKGFMWVPEREKLILGGVAFQHQFFDKKGYARPINALLSSQLMSNVSWHNHGYAEREVERADKKVQRAIVAGCWKSPIRNPYEEDVRRGLLMMHDVRDGEFHHQFIPQHIVAQQYRQDVRRLAA